MNRFLLVALLSTIPALAVAQKTCESFTKTITNIQDVVLNDFAEHDSGDHAVATSASAIFGSPTTGNIVGTCRYTTGSGPNCDTSCNITSNPISNRDTGSLNAFGSHMSAGSKNDGSSSATNGGASCTETVGGGAVNCFAVLGHCFVTASVSAGGVSLNTNGHEVWKTSKDIPLNCGALADPNYVPPPPPPPPPNPCDIDPSSSDCCADSNFTPTPKNSCPPIISSESPIIIDTEGEGFRLTSAREGVRFDMSGSGHPVQIAWTAAGSHNAFLALPGGDGLIHNGTQLFGNFTKQPPSNHPNGFLALAEFDKSENGGNSDGVIDQRDAVFSQLRLWIDENHDGISQPSELHPLPEVGIYSLSLNYFESKRVDQFGNEFRYKARVNPDQRHRDPRDTTESGEPGRWTYDVFLKLR